MKMLLKTIAECYGAMEKISRVILRAALAAVSLVYLAAILLLWRYEGFFPDYDTALCAVADILRSNCGEEDFVMRYGGDEFVVIAIGTDSELRDHILAAAEAWNKTSGQPFTLGLSIGVVLATKKAKRSLEDCIKEADTLMYEIKTERNVGR